MRDEETDDLIVGRILEPGNHGYGFFRCSVHQYPLAVLPCSYLVLVYVVDEDHGDADPDQQDGCKQEIRQKGKEYGAVDHGTGNNHRQHQHHLDGRHPEDTQ